MIPSRLRFVGMIAAAAIVAGACSSAAVTPAPTATPAPATPAPTAVVAATPAPTAAALPAAPAGDLIKAGTLTVCSDTSYPPQETLDTSNKAIGSDIDLITEVAKRLNLTLSVKSTVFDSIVPALTGGTCDVSISAQTINADRQLKVDMIPYFSAGQSFVVQKGNPAAINTLDDLCGKTVAAEKGTVEADHITGGASGYDNTTALSPLCTSKGKKPITLKVFDADTAALLALQSGTVQAHFTDEPVANYEVTNGKGKFEVASALTLEKAAEGICVTKNHTGLRDAVKAAVQQMMDDGTYLQILTKWNVQSGALTSTAPAS
jgi:polar amino acid transport system substrate-binding protein